MVIPCQPPLTIIGNHAEKRSFHYIQTKNLSETFGRCEIDLWESTILLHCHQNPAVRTSFLALSAIYEIYETKILSNDRSTISLGRLPKHAFTQYAKAVAIIIQCLRSNTKRNNNDRKGLLISCLVFTWVEIMLCNLETARWHLDSGINIINDLATNPEINIERDDPDDVYGSLHRSFLRLKFQLTVGLDASPMGDAGSPRAARQTSEPSGEIQKPEMGRSPSMAKVGLQVSQSENVELTWTRQGRGRQLERLRKADEAINKRPVHTIQEEDRRRSLTFVNIKLSRAVLSLITEARSRGLNTLSDSRYLEVIEIMEDIYHRKKLMQPTPASLDFGMNPPLFFTVKVGLTSCTR